MTVKDLPHNLAFTVALATEGAVCSGVRGKQTGDVTHGEAYKHQFNTLVSNYANLSLSKTVNFFLHFHLESQGKYDLSKWPLFFS